jgi:hypothetical protein
MEQLHAMQEILSANIEIKKIIAFLFLVGLSAVVFQLGLPSYWSLYRKCNFFVANSRIKDDSTLGLTILTAWLSYPFEF